MSIPIHSGPSPINYSSSVARNQTSNTGDQAALQGHVVEVGAHSHSSQKVVTEGTETLTYSRSVRTQSWSAQSVSTDAVTGRLGPPETNQYAGTILSAIEGQLMRDMADGADADALASRLQAGLDGFLQGYNEALSQLQGLPGFDDGVLAQIGETRSQVLDRLAQFAEHHGIEYVAPEADTKLEPASVVADGSRSPDVSVSYESKAVLGQKVLESAVRDLRILTEYVERSSREVTYQKQTPLRAQNEQYAYQVQRQNSFAFNLTTRDGDVVTINVQANRSGYAGVNASGDRVSQGRQSEELTFSVEGELDSDELEAINGLLGEVRDIAALFFEGDMDGAVSQALSLNYDASEINTFDVHLNRSVTEAAFYSVGSDGQEGGTLERLQHKLASAVDRAAGLNQPKSFIADLTDWVTQQMNPQHHWSHNAGNLIKTLL